MVKPILLLLLLSSPVFAQGKREYRVVRVIDGDTVSICCFGKKPQTVRLLGINAPEATSKNIQPGGLEATAYLKALVEGRSVYVGNEPKARVDRFGRKLLYLWRAPDKVFLNLQLVEEGLARFEPRFRVRFKSALMGAESRARKAKKGVWSGGS